MSQFLKKQKRGFTLFEKSPPPMTGTPTYSSGRSRTGFTLVELLVAIGLFAIVLTFSLGSVVSILDAGRKARSLQSVMTNLNFTLETMTREMKFGSHYHCIIISPTPEPFPPSFTPLIPQNCSGNPNSAQPAIAFISNDGTGVIYMLNGGQILKSINGGSTFISVTAPEVQIASLKFYVFGATPQTTSPIDNAQPRITMVVSGNAGTKVGTQTSFVVQTTVSARALDLGP